jgi:hypothetical protein
VDAFNQLETVVSLADVVYKERPFAYALNFARMLISRDKLDVCSADARANATDLVMRHLLFYPAFYEMANLHFPTE